MTVYYYYDNAVMSTSSCKIILVPIVQPPSFVACLAKWFLFSTVRLGWLPLVSDLSRFLEERVSQIKLQSPSNDVDGILGEADGIVGRWKSGLLASRSGNILKPIAF